MPSVCQWSSFIFILSIKDYRCSKKEMLRITGITKSQGESRVSQMLLQVKSSFLFARLVNMNKNLMEYLMEVYKNLEGKETD